jgi:hypothetical protein
VYHLPAPNTFFQHLRLRFFAQQNPPAGGGQQFAQRGSPPDQFHILTIQIFTDFEFPSLLQLLRTNKKPANMSKSDNTGVASGEPEEW